MSSFYITTTLPYVNAQPHIGHALEFVQADVIARRRTHQGDDVLFNVGTDEHGLKIFQKAEEMGMSVHDFVDMNVQTFVDFFEQFSIGYTNFSRTSSQSHIAVAQGMRNRCLAAGDIYKKTYSGLYCVGCESFKTPKDLVDGNCPDHHTAPMHVEQENYFFKLSRYADTLRTYYTTHDALLPKQKLPELLNFLDQMEDISISRTKESLPRGVPVPNDPDQVMYVWFDALSNYIGAAGFPDDEDKIATYRPGIQLFGPDNLRFQCAIRQGMLASAGFPLSKHLLMHGMILGPDGNKMSKTLGNVISPIDQLNIYGAEAVRFYLIAGIPTFSDAAYKEDDLVALYNSRLSHGFGNLLSRVITLAAKRGLQLQANRHDARQHASAATRELLQTHTASIEALYDTYELHHAAGAIHDLALLANKFVDDHKPREATHDDATVEQILYDLGAYCATLVDLYRPIIPHACAQAETLLSTMTKSILFPNLS